MTVQVHRMGNGLRVVTERMPSMKSASIGVWVLAGGRHEAPEQNGIAHFLEHMAFKGTKTRSALQIAEAIEDVGGYINAYTSREMTAYYARVLEEDTGLALDVIGDIVLNQVFDPKEIEIERTVILQEIGQSHDTPDDVIFDWLQEASYPAQPMGRTILGPAERVRAFNRSDLQRFVGEYYGPGQLVIAAAGAVDHDVIVRQAEELFGHLEPRTPPAEQGAHYVGGDVRREKDLEQVHFALALESPGYRAADVYDAQIHSVVLGGGMSSRLFQEVREKRGLCYTIFAQASAFADSGLLTIYAGTGADDLPQLAELTIDELRRVADDLRTPELDRARSQMKAGLLMGLESPSNRCERLARMIAIWDRVPTLDETVARIDAVTPDSLRAYSERVCAGALTLALYGPVSKAPSYEDLQARLVA
ncbi:M16 family metallopeptidase [Oceanomicrobium pacificus]|uniref:Insulinase family protein n=1 Tax=Oceanomicrobium pacificus TaxID=2692916 RepID=A0A6B0TS88_9RHOB|nr:pitrilysin family protein [Oceanomicrobium pacificus]MXU66856.1 insulinase family protein [Oceanomicrobium pacificus]